jgi:hypothetical protein
VRVSAFRIALPVAASTHVALAAALMTMRSPRRPAPPTEAETLFELSDEPSPRVSPSPPLLPASLPASPAPAAANARAASPDLAPQASPVAESLAPLQVPSAVPSAAPWSLNAPGVLALGVGDYWRHVALEGPAPSSTASAPDARSAEIDRALRLGLAARDMELGLGASGPLVSAAHEAASMAPDVGAATLDIDVDGTGKVVTARVVTVSDDRAGWNAMAEEIVRIASGKTVHVRAGSRGVRARLRIVAERVPPAGTKRTSSAGAVPDDVAGGMDGKACDGEGAERRCVGGMPLGGSTTLGDLANIGAKAARIVHVTVLGEAAL